MTRLTLISRTYCHLCHEMESALLPLAAEFGVAVDVLDVDDDPELEALFNELVPVLLYQGAELCHYFLDVDKVRAWLSAHPGEYGHRSENGRKPGLKPRPERQ